MNEEMEITVVPVEDLHEWPTNVRVHTTRNLEALKRCLSRFGQVKPILVQKSSMAIIAGNGTYQAVCALGWPSIKCNLLDLSDEEANALAIADNRTGELSEWNNQRLVETLKDLRQFDEGMLELSGFDSMELDKMVRFTEGDMFKKLEPDGGKKPVEKAKSSEFPERKEPEPAQDSEVQEQSGPTEKEIAEYDEQVSFTISGFVFSCSDKDTCHELRALMELLKGSDRKVQKKVSASVMKSIQDILTEELMR